MSKETRKQLQQRALRLRNDPKRIVREMPVDTPEEDARYRPANQAELAKDNKAVCDMVDAIEAETILDLDEDPGDAGGDTKH